MTIEAEFLSPLGPKALLFRNMNAREELGRLSEVVLDLLRLSKLTPLKAKDLLGQEAGVRILRDDGTFRYINGVVTRFERGGTLGRFDVYRLELRPWLWHLTQGADCRVFQDKTAVQIIDLVLAEYVSAARVEKKLTGSFSTRPYTIQFNESDYNFVTRLMEEEGIYYYFTHAHGRHTLVLTNGASGHLPMPGATLGWASAEFEDKLREDIVTDWSSAHALRPLKYAHTDFSAESPTANLLGSATRTAPYPAPNDLEIHRYPGQQDDLLMAPGTTTAKQQEGKRTAQLHVDAMESGHHIASAVTPWRDLTIGSTFTLKDHPEDNGGYLVTSVFYKMEFAGYEANEDQLSTSYSCRFDCVPKSVPFQPERVAQAPDMRGPQTATVVGPSGDEIHTDKYGRVKIQFHWDRLGPKNEKSSCFVRVSQAHAGKGFGFISLPRIGEEVVVDFLEGNPDRPLVTGRVYNGDNLPPYPLPAQASVSGWRSHSTKQGAATNFNELRFQDDKGNEYVWLQAEKDFHRLVKNDDFDTVQGNHHGEVQKDSNTKIGQNQSHEVVQQFKAKIGTDAHADVGGDLLLKVKGATGLDSTGAIQVKSAAGIKVESGAAMDLKASAAIHIGSATVHVKGDGQVVIEAGASMTIKAGAGTITLGIGGVTIDGPFVKINCGGGGGSATAAASASPPAPAAPTAPAANTDPLA